MTNCPDTLIVKLFQYDEETRGRSSVEVVTVVLDAAMPVSSRLNLLAHLTSSSNPAVPLIVTDSHPPGAAPLERVPERLVRAAQYIRVHCSKPLYLDSIAREACLSKFHFCREFKRYFGVSPIQFQINSRIHLALDIMAEGTTPLAQVAGHCGFSDQSEFSKWFKRVTGSPPSSYRITAMNTNTLPVGCEFSNKLQDSSPPAAL